MLQSESGSVGRHFKKATSRSTGSSTAGGGTRHDGLCTDGPLSIVYSITIVMWSINVGLSIERCSNRGSPTIQIHTDWLSTHDIRTHTL